MKAEKKNYVTFYSPGTFVSETTRRPIDAWDTAVAVKMARDIVERHGAKPYAFRFITCLEAPPITVDGAEGQKLDVTPKQTAQSGLHHLGGEVLTFAMVERRNDPSESILRTNMRGNGYALVVENRNSYRSVHPLDDDDVIVDPATGAITARASDPQFADYAKQQRAAWKVACHG